MGTGRRATTGRGGTCRVPLVALLVIAGCAGGVPPGAGPGPAEPAALSPSESRPASGHAADGDAAFLLRWVRGERESLLFARYARDYPNSPHAAESLRFEAALRALAARELAGKSRSALLGALRDFVGGGDADPEAAARALEVLGRLGAAEEMDTLLGALAAEDERVRAAAAVALSFFGEAPVEETFFVYGGRVRRILTPPRPDPRAREALFLLRWEEEGRPLLFPEGGDLDARLCHVLRVLEELPRCGPDRPFVLLGREIGPYGRAAASAWLSQWFLLPGIPGAEEALRAVVDAGVPGAATPTLELAMATAALAAAVRNKEMRARRVDAPPLAGRTRGDLLRFLAGLAGALAARQAEDGTWGGPVETAWAMAALLDASETSPMVRGPLGEEWRRAGAAVLARWKEAREPADASAVDRLHGAAAVALADRIAPAGTERPGAAWYQRRFRDLDPGQDADTWFAAAFLWRVWTPSKDPDHPLQGCKARLREDYLGGRLRPETPGETFALTAAIESFGWDDFGWVLGYLFTDDWPPLEED